MTEPNPRESQAPAGAPTAGDPKAPIARVLGVAVFGACAIGILSAVAAIGAMDQSDFVGAGACLFAGAVSFGLLLNAFLR